jgi:hypothetical protein
MVIGVTAFLGGLATAQVLQRGGLLSPLAAYAPEISAETGRDGSVVLRTAPTGKRYLVVVDPTASVRNDTRGRERPKGEGTTRISLHTSSVTLPRQDALATRVYELLQVVECPDGRCKICQPGGPDACTDPPDPLPPPSIFPPEGYGLYLLNAQHK